MSHQLDNIKVTQNMKKKQQQSSARQAEVKSKNNGVGFLGVGCLIGGVVGSKLYEHLIAGAPKDNNIAQSCATPPNPNPKG